MLTCLLPYQYGNYLGVPYPDRDDKLESALTHLLACQPNLRQRHQRLSQDVAQICEPADWTPALRQFIQQVSLE